MNIDSFKSQMRNQRLSEQRELDITASKTKLTGEIRVNGAGEVSADVTFPVMFTEKPVMNFGAELIEGDAIEEGLMPTVSVVVLAWVTREKPPVSRQYVGAKLGIVIGGAAYQKLSVHWSVEGTALSNPV